MQGRQERFSPLRMLDLYVGYYHFHVPDCRGYNRSAMMDEFTPLDRVQISIAAALEQLELVSAPTQEHKDTVRLLLERALIAANNIYQADKGQCMLNWE